MNRSEHCMNLKSNIILARMDPNVSKTRLKPAEVNYVEEFPSSAPLLIMAFH